MVKCETPMNRALLASTTDARGQHAAALAGSTYDGAWNLIFVTQRGGCDPNCSFGINIANGIVSHPNLLMGAEVVENDVKLAVRRCCGEAIHEVEKLNPATSFRMRRKDLPGGDFQRGKQRGRAVPLVVVALPGQGPAVGQLQIALRSFQGLDRWLFVHA